ncbi:hypothetical protein [Arthrobacter sp. NEB 688]|uniref:hypothetical protein n=1 Tax=Arthrobacter sp. NEB 688 TaxID=904039 RepID=UPI0015661977|nr:hypothetical protein [Arthrobacter sp. NEB 688]QKE85159.1 hypothetical protein HL663_15260 [Arthrobacter sp. NEB 688]
MKLRWTGFRSPGVPADVAAAIDPTDGEKLLAWAGDGLGTTLVAGRHRLYVVGPGDGEGAAPVVRRARPWHLVDAGLWSEDGVLRITWVDDESPLRQALTEPGMFPETLRERVQASVVLAETIDVGRKGTAKVVVRRDLATDALLSQAVLGRGVSISDPGVADDVQAGIDRVREQVGLD